MVNLMRVKTVNFCNWHPESGDRTGDAGRELNASWEPMHAGTC